MIPCYIGSNKSKESSISSRFHPRTKEEQKLSAFASLLSSAQSSGLEEDLTPTPQPLLANLLSSKVHFNKNDPKCRHTCSYPSLCIINNSTSSLCAEKGMSQKDAAALNLAFPIFADKGDIASAPVLILRNFSESFSELVDSRFRTSKNALLKEFIKRNDIDGAKHLSKVLSHYKNDSPPYSLLTVVTSFYVPSVEGKVVGNEISLPLVFESTMDFKVFTTPVTISTQAQGTITGCFQRVDGRLERVEILFFSIELLDNMMKQVKYLVRKIISQATGVNSTIPPPLKDSSLPEKHLEDVSSKNYDDWAIRDSAPNDVSKNKYVFDDKSESEEMKPVISNLFDNFETLIVERQKKKQMAYHQRHEREKNKKKDSSQICQDSLNQPMFPKPLLSDMYEAFDLANVNEKKEQDSEQIS